MAGAADEEVKNQLKELEAILEESDKRIRQMVENIPNAMVYFMDKDGNILYMNHALEAAVGDNFSEKSYAKLTNASEEQVEAALRKVKTVLETTHPIVIAKEKLVLHNGFTRTVRTQIAPLEYNGQPACMVLSLIVEDSDDAPEDASRKHAADDEEQGAAKKTKGGTSSSSTSSSSSSSGDEDGGDAGDAQGKEGQ